MESEPKLTPREKYPLPEKILLRRASLSISTFAFPVSVLFVSTVFLPHLSIHLHFCPLPTSTNTITWSQNVTTCAVCKQSFPITLFDQYHHLKSECDYLRSV